MTRLRHFARNSKGGPLLEFALASLMFVTVLIATLEFGLEMYARNVTDRLANRASEAYALTRDLSVIDEVFTNRADAITSRCLQPVRVVLFDEVSSIDVLFDSGREADGTVSDDSAVAFRLEVQCVWPRITPALGGLLGSVGGHNSVTVLRFRDGV